jgi:U4/U6 small nuclear ribonucleoprotein PRP4
MCGRRSSHTSRCVNAAKHVSFSLTVFLKSFANLGSQIGDDRPISQVRFSPNSKILATGSWSGTVKLWNVPACTPISSLRGNLLSSLQLPEIYILYTGHSDRVGGVAWHPQATLSQSESAVNLVSGGADGHLALWSLGRYA